MFRKNSDCIDLCKSLVRDIGGGMRRTIKLILASFLLFTLSFLLFTNEARANNIAVSNAFLGAQDTSAHTMVVQFDISWNNAWYDANNYDAAWVFIKYSTNSGTTWAHATLKVTDANNLTSGTGGVGNPTGFSCGTATYSGSSTNVSIDVPTEATSGKKGAFVHLSAAVTGSGTNTLTATGLQFVWDYGTDIGTSSANDVTAAAAIIRVMAIEMVYIPTGSFYVGSGGTESGSFTAGSWVSGATIPFQISSENQLTINTGNVAYLWGTSTSGNNTIGSSGTLPAAFPKGYNAFYMMKYKISQKQYADFLNTLTSGQAASYYPSYNGNYRYTISGSWPNYSASRPDRACNYLAWSDLYAYTDWAALRPMTELEFEKACRGTAAPVANEYAWGFSDSPTVTAVAATTIFGTTEDGTEIITNAGANSCFGSQVYTGGDATGQSDTSPYPYTRGPLRCGIFATGSSTTRKASGASYYGVMELSGGLWERPVTVAAAAAFTGVHGDGDITTAPSNWPSSSTAAGAGFRGGGWSDAATSARTSDRVNAAYTLASRFNFYGGRCVRTSP